MTEALRVRAIMDPDVLRLSPDDPIRAAVAGLVARNAAAAPVLGPDGALVGILTQKDCFRPALHASYYQEWRGTVGERMSHRVVTIDAADNAVHAAEVFLDHPHRVFPVLENGAVVGMLDRAAVLAALFRSG